MWLEQFPGLANELPRLEFRENRHRTGDRRHGRRRRRCKHFSDFRQALRCNRCAAALPYPRLLQHAAFANPLLQSSEIDRAELLAFRANDKVLIH
jgi:hypothetical protein